MSRKRSSLEDPRGVIAESYVIEGLTDAQARSIFMDWAMMDAGEEPMAMMEVLLARFENSHPDHPMTRLLQEGLSQQAKPQRRGRRRS